MAQRPVAFYHRDGLVAAWNHASRYAGTNGRIATLPELVELRLGAAAGPSNSPWENWYTSASAEYVGFGADGRSKIIIAHGVGPMADLDGIKAAYKWEYGDKSRDKRGGRITAQQFLDLEAGKYGDVTTVKLHPDWIIEDNAFKVSSVNVLDFQDYLDMSGSDVFVRYLNKLGAQCDPLLRMRLGQYSSEYFGKHEQIAKEFHQKERPNDQYTWSKGYDDRTFPYITQVQTASNCSYVSVDREIEESEVRWVYTPRVPEKGYALAHLLSLDGFTRLHASEVGVMLMSAPDVHEWWNGAKFVAIPEAAVLDAGLDDGPDAGKVLRDHWSHFIESVEEPAVPIEPFRLECAGTEWFTRYAKQSPNEDCMDDGNIEFHVRSVERMGRAGNFTIDDDFFLRYKLSQVKAIMPRGANAYEIVNISSKDSHGLTTVTVLFYRADVDISKRLPRSETIARNFDRLMEVYTH